MPQTRSNLTAMPSRLSGFTLTELLVVLGIVALLAAILFPVIASSRRKAQDTTCVQNLRQLSQALTMYTSDYDGVYPMGVEGVVINHTVEENNLIWGDLLLPYLHVHVIPVCPTRDTSLLDEKEKQQTPSCGYIINARLSRRHGTKDRNTQEGRPETMFAFPSLTVTLYDARIGMIEGNTPDTALTPDALNQFFRHPIDPDLATFFLSQPPGGTRHHGGAHYAFADGHVKWLQPSGLSIEKKSDGVKPGFGL